MRSLALGRRGERGLTLIELIIAGAIATLFFAAAVPMFGTALEASRSDQMRVVAETIAQQKIEQIRELQFDQLSKLTDGSVNLTTWMGGAFNPTVSSYVGTQGKTYTVAYTVTFNPTNAAPTAAQNAQVTVTVSWVDVAYGKGTHNTAQVTLETVISRQFSGPGVQNVTLSPLNGLNQLDSGPTTINVYITPQDAGTNNSGVGSVTVTVADVNNSTFTPVALTATAVSNGVFTTSWNQSGATANDTFSFTAQATNASQTPGNPFVVNAKLVTGQNPNPVTNFVIAPGNQCLLLTWDNSTATDFNHYELWRGPSSSSMTPLVTNLQASGYIDTGLTNGTTYYYEVRVVDNDGNPSTWVTGSKAPAVQSDTVTPGMPANFTAVRSNANASLSWNVPSAGTSGIAGYLIYRDAQPYARYAPGGTAGSLVTYSDVIGYSVAHTYSVVAFNGVGLVSAATPTLTVNTATAPTETLTVTTTKASPGVSVDVVQSDAQPDPQDDGTKTATSLASAVWTGLPYGSYTITATSGSSQVIQNITLTQNMTVASGL